jgi:hypothetical protein
VAREGLQAQAAPDQAALEGALAAIITNTKRRRRNLDLLEVAKHVQTAREAFCSLKAVADSVLLSEQMLSEFLAVRRLAPEVRQLVADRQIDSVDMVRRLTGFPAQDQVNVAQAVAARQLDSHDVRAVLALRKALPEPPIRDIINRVVTSRDIRQYLAEFVVPFAGTEPAVLRSRFAEIVGEENIRALEISGRLGVLAMNSEGRRRLQGAAKSRGLTKRMLIDTMLIGEKTEDVHRPKRSRRRQAGQVPLQE